MLMRGLFVAKLFQELVMLGLQLVERGGQFGRHVLASLPVGRGLAAFFMQSSLSGNRFRNLRLDFLHLLDRLGHRFALLLDDYHITLNGLKLLAKHLRFRLKYLRVHHR